MVGVTVCQLMFSITTALFQIDWPHVWQYDVPGIKIVECELQVLSVFSREALTMVLS